MKKNNTTLKDNKSEKLAEKLNLLLANFQIHYQNLRGIHWNIKGKQFFQLHLKFEELYNDAQIKIDETAERILMLGYKPLHTFSDYIKNATIKEEKNLTKDIASVKMVVQNMKDLILIERDALKIAETINDNSSQDLITQFISFHEKTIWMFTSWLEE